MDPTRSVVLYVGNLLPVKGPDVLIEAAARLAAGGAAFDLHVIGRGPLRESLERRAAEAGLAGRVHFHGPMPHDRLPDWFRAADLLVLPSRSEGVPNVLRESGVDLAFVDQPEPGSVRLAASDLRSGAAVVEPGAGQSDVAMDHGRLTVFEGGYSAYAERAA